MKEVFIPLNERIIFALDVESRQNAEDLIARFSGQINFFKVGLQLFLAAGWPVVDSIVARGCKVMLDLKLYDIPETVRLAVQQFADRGITFATVHAVKPVMEAAVAADAGVGILAVTVLTSSGTAREAGSALPVERVEDLVLARAKEAAQLGCAGAVCSAKETPLLKTALSAQFQLVTPGIRPLGAAAHDQQRICTPKKAIANGADYLVIGRPIRDAADPETVIGAMQEEIQAGLDEKKRMLIRH